MNNCMSQSPKPQVNITLAGHTIPIQNFHYDIFWFDIFSSNNYKDECETNMNGYIPESTFFRSKEKVTIIS